MRGRLGFTLIELLVVIAIIAILAAIMFPVFSKAKESAHIAACLSNTRQIGTAVTLYSESWNGNMPQACNIWSIHHSGYDQTKWNYFETLKKYTKGYSVYICPGKPIDDIRQSLTNLWTKDPITGQPSDKLKGATYTPTHHNHIKNEQNWPGGNYAHKCWSQSFAPNGTPYDSSYNPSGIDSIWRHGLVNFDTVNFDALGAKRSSAVILFCMSGAWRGFTKSEGGSLPDDSDGLYKGSHRRGTPALFADMHVKFVEAGRVGKL